jgi:hypothetical protein
MQPANHGWTRRALAVLVVLAVAGLGLVTIPVLATWIWGVVSTWY